MKNVLITGACGGMGRATAEALQKEGVRVFCLDRREAEKTKTQIPIPADLSSPESIKQAAEKVKSYTDSLDAIVHFGGIYRLDSLVEMEEAEFEAILRINLMGAYLINKHFLPFLKKNGRILITTSELAPLDPLPFTGIYAVTKAALDKYAYSLRMELQLLGIHVSVLRAGAVDTGMLGASTEALRRFCETTRLYSCNASRFEAIVNRVEARRIPPKRLAQKALTILKKKKPAFAYAINRNPLLLLLNRLPQRLQLWIIKTILQ